MSKCQVGSPDQRFEFFKDNDFFHQAMSTRSRNYQINELFVSRRYCLKITPLGTLKLKGCDQAAKKPIKKHRYKRKTEL